MRGGPPCRQKPSPSEAPKRQGAAAAVAKDVFFYDAVRRYCAAITSGFADSTKYPYSPEPLSGSYVLWLELQLFEYPIGRLILF